MQQPSVTGDHPVLVLVPNAPSGFDHIALATEHEDEADEPTDRSYWIAAGSPATVALAEQLTDVARHADPQPGLNAM